MSISPASFAFVRRLVEDQTGIVLDDSKAYLADVRLVPLVRRTDSTDVNSLVGAVQSGRVPGLARQIVEAMLIHETSFFRDPACFDQIATAILPHLVEQRREQRTLRIWCAACSSGQEPYSIAMLLCESFGALLPAWNIELIASDLSRPMIGQAREGVYSEVEVGRGLTAARLARHFHREGNSWRIAPALRQMVTFRELNLHDPWPALPAMDLVLLRNVLIYMSAAVRERILQRLRSVIHDGGFVVLGATETGWHAGHGYVPSEIGPAYCLRPAP